MPPLPDDTSFAPAAPVAARINPLGPKGTFTRTDDVTAMVRDAVVALQPGLSAPEGFGPLVTRELTPSNGHYEAKSTRIAWQEALADTTVNLFGCDSRSVRGNAFELAGPRLLVGYVAVLLGPLFSALPLTADARYLELFYKLKNSTGDVSGARGQRATILDSLLKQVRAGLGAGYSTLAEADPTLNPRLREVARLVGLAQPFAAPAPTPRPRKTPVDRGFRRPITAPTSGHELVSPGVLPPPLVTSYGREGEPTPGGLTPVTTASPPAGYAPVDERVLAVFRPALEHHGLAQTTEAVGVAFDTRPKGFSLDVALTLATRRLGRKPTHFAARSGVLYLNAPSAPDNPWLLVATTSPDSPTLVETTV